MLLMDEKGGHTNSKQTSLLQVEITLFSLKYRAQPLGAVFDDSA